MLLAYHITWKQSVMILYKHLVCEKMGYRAENNSSPTLNAVKIGESGLRAPTQK